uniref:Uncharacterized protein TCIL3000_6_3160 n=2 Tax=Trypanosoma congolense (strain IL3000) TaxID=1068625 RepID=G0UNV5_TRYCI|nr:unnamed protein product [Trypanosoma congolense IL3000]
MKSCHLLRALCASPKVGLASVPAVEQHPVAEEQPIYLKPSRGKYRKPSFVIPRMKGELPAYAYRAPPLGSAAPMFCITSASCEYFALRLPILKAGFKRIPVQTAPQIPSNLLWGRSLLLRPPNSLAPAMGGNFDVARSVIPTDASAACADGSSTLKMICAHQRFNHFPRTYGTIGCKLGLTLRLRHAVKSLELGKGKHGLYNFFPRTWVFPEEKESVKLALLQAKPTQRFIWKPARGSCGRGIFICPGGPKNAKYWEDIVQKMEKRVLTSSSMVNRNYVVQEYIDDPLLLDGRKMDLRLYVAVTSYDPLTIYLHEEGLVRLAVQQYGDGPDASANDCGAHEGCTPHFEPFRDLTNYSVGRKWVKRGKQGGSRDDHVDDVEPLSSEEQGYFVSSPKKKYDGPMGAY